MSTAPTTSTPEPFAARALPLLPDTDPINDALRRMATACNGALYAGDRIEGQLSLLRWLRANPSEAAALLT